jgi:hypothetical protein
MATKACRQLSTLAALFKPTTDASIAPAKEPLPAKFSSLREMETLPSGRENYCPRMRQLRSFVCGIAGGMLAAKGRNLECGAEKRYKFTCASANLMIETTRASLCSEIQAIHFCQESLLLSQNRLEHK